MRARAWLQERRAECGWRRRSVQEGLKEQARAPTSACAAAPTCPRTRFPAALWQACQDALKQARSRQRIPSASVHSARSPAPRSVQRSHAAPQVPCASPPSPGSPLRHGGQPAAPQPPRRASPPSVPRAARRRLSPVHGHTQAVCACASGCRHAGPFCATLAGQSCLAPRGPPVLDSAGAESAGGGSRAVDRASFCRLPLLPPSLVGAGLVGGVALVAGLLAQRSRGGEGSHGASAHAGRVCMASMRAAAAREPALACVLQRERRTFCSRSAWRSPSARLSCTACSCPCL